MVVEQILSGRSVGEVAQISRCPKARCSAGHRATTAQWHAERRACRPKASKLTANEPLCEYVQDRLAGAVDVSLRRTADHLEYMLTDAVGPDGAFIGNLDKEISVDGPFITSRSVAELRECARRIMEHLKSLAQA